MFVSFVNLVNEYAVIRKYNVPIHIVPEIKKYMDINVDYKECIFSFGRFVQFDAKYHGEALTYLFEKTKVDRKVVGEDENNYQITYEFKDIENVKENLDKNQMLFLCGLMHNLNYQSYLLPLVSILMSEYKMKFEDIKKYAKSDDFKMQMFGK